jgi:hypothetical protein
VAAPGSSDADCASWLEFISTNLQVPLDYLPFTGISAQVATHDFGAMQRAGTLTTIEAPT